MSKMQNKIFSTDSAKAIKAHDFGYIYVIQCHTYEALAPFGPVVAALAAGFAVMLWDQIYITQDGERYAGIDE
ncbi:MAG: hypothetical protein ACHP7H_00380 [Hyphomicrobiales bacterium]